MTSTRRKIRPLSSGATDAEVARFLDSHDPEELERQGIMVRDDVQLEEVRKKLTQKYKLKLEPPFRCDFRDPWGNRIQVVDLHDESLVWLLPYREVQKTGIKFDSE